MLVAYDGGGLHGFAMQPGVAPLGGALAGPLQRQPRHTVQLTRARRTDTRRRAGLTSFPAAGP